MRVVVVGAENFSAMCTDDAVADAQAQSGTFSGLLGGEEGIEDALRIGYASAVVGEGDFDEIILAWVDFD